MGLERVDTVRWNVIRHITFIFLQIIKWEVISKVIKCKKIITFIYNIFI